MCLSIPALTGPPKSLNLLTIKKDITMLRYRLDDLGWFQFEWLVQSLLKSKCGLGVESWGGSNDYGKDAYSKESLKFPANRINKGPFVFQVKFVQDANAAGASAEKKLVAAIAKENERIVERRKQKKWKDPRHYSLVTNAPISAELRKEVVISIRQTLRRSSIHILSGSDICDLLDHYENLRRAFPQLLSLRDLNELIGSAVSRETRERSQAAVECAREIVPVYVPTSSYEKAWKVLHDHNFVVLEGPPEMGKTAVAWMISLTLHSQGWQAVVCDNPSDFFKLHNSTEKQIFIADDAFGRTEYDPSRGRKWEQQLERILQLLNGSHWLIWTSRKHILERALNAMDLQGKAQKFPAPASVLVNASHLTVKEKALILYRHARAVGLEEPAKNLVKACAVNIVHNENFTPERIRRFVREVLPTLATKDSGLLTPDLIMPEVDKAIKTPTVRMIKSFKALSHNHKLLLLSVVEAGDNPTNEQIQEIYETHSASLSTRVPFEHLLDELSESFLRSYSTYVF